jgi:hypothetical protein
MKIRVVGAEMFHTDVCILPYWKIRKDLLLSLLQFSVQFLFYVAHIVAPFMSLASPNGAWQSQRIAEGYDPSKRLEVRPDKWP